MTVVDSVLTGNAARLGGAIYESGAYALFTIYSTLNDNQAYYGGAIVSPQGAGLIGAATLSGNKALYGGAVDAFGAQIYDSTVSGNKAYLGGSGGVFAYYGYSGNSILANNTGGSRTSEVRTGTPPSASSRTRESLP